jgi:transposase
MTIRKFRTYPDEFKREVLELLKSSGKSAAAIERELGITPGLVVKWRNYYQAKQKGVQKVVLEPSDLEAAKPEIKHLKRQLADVEEEREILNKVLHTFSRPDKPQFSSLKHTKKTTQSTRCASR